MKWRYQFYLSNQQRDHKDFEDAMNDLGQDGWELIETYIGPSGDRVFVLKRPIDE
jgi:hypothetical protein